MRRQSGPTSAAISVLDRRPIEDLTCGSAHRPRRVPGSTDRFDRDEGNTRPMRGIVSIAGYVPYRRLQRSAVAAGVRHGRRQGHPIGGLPRRGHHHHGRGGGPPGPALGARRGARAPLVRHRHARLPRQDQRRRHPRRPPAAVRRGRLRLRRRAALGDRAPCVRPAPPAPGTTLVVMADLRDGLPTSATSRPAATAAAALLVGRRRTGHAGDRRVPGRGLGQRRVPRPLAGRRATGGRSCGRSGSARPATSPSAPRPGSRASKAAGRRPPTRSTGWRSPACTPGRSKALGRKLGVGDGAVADDLASTVGQTGTAHPALVLASHARAGRHRARWLAVVVAGRRRRRRSSSGPPTASGRVAPGPTRWPTRSPRGADLAYGKFLTWRGMVTPEPPRRPEPQRVSASAAWRSEDWKFGFVGSRDRTSRRRAPAAGPGLDEGRSLRRHGARRPMADTDGHHRHLHHRPDGLLPEPADRLRRRSTSTAAGGSRSS